MRRFLCLLLSIVLLLAGLTGCARPVEEEKESKGLLYDTFDEYVANSVHLHPETDEHFRYALYDNFAQIIECISTEPNLIIPDEYKGVPVIGIRDGAFSECTTLEHLTIGQNVLQIGASAFSNCTSLTQVKMSSSVNEIKESAFTGCEALVSITIPPKVTTLYASTFSGCRSLRQVVIEAAEMEVSDEPSRGDTATATERVIEASTFSDCDRLAIMWIPEDITTVTDSILGGTTPKPLICGGDASASSWFATLQCLDYEVVDRDDFNSHARMYQQTLAIDKNEAGEAIECGVFDIMLEDVQSYNKLGNLTAGDNHVLLAVKFRIHNTTMIPQYFSGLNVTCTSTAPDRDGMMKTFTKQPLMMSTDVLDMSYPVGNVPANSFIEGVIVLRVSERYESVQITFNGMETPFVI